MSGSQIFSFSMDKDKQVITDLQEGKDVCKIILHRTLQNISMVGWHKYFVIAVQEKNLHLNLNKHEQAIQDSCLFKYYISELMLPSHTNFSGHGGYILSYSIKLHLPLHLSFLELLCHSLRGYSGLPESYRSRRTSNNESQCKLCWK
jgi:hypothetical protein